MNWDQIEGNWEQFKGKVKTQWGKLTDNDITAAAGNRQQLAGAIQKRYGYAKEQTERELDRFASDCGCDSKSSRKMTDTSSRSSHL